MANFDSGQSKNSSYVLKKNVILGTGAFSHVFEALEAGSGQPVVAKVTSLAEKVNACCHAKEVRAFKRLKAGHKGIVKFYDDFVVEQCGVVILEKLTKYTIKDISDCQGPFPTLDALEYFWDIVCAVEYMHNCYVSPRDLKVENIAFDKITKRPKIFDLGLAVVIEPDSKGRIPFTNITTGSPLYMSPEVLSHKDHNTFKHDIWCLGIVLYFMLTGRSPHQYCATFADLYEELVVKKQMVYPSWLDDEVVGLLKGMLEFHPIKRMTIQEVKNALRNVLVKISADEDAAASETADTETESGESQRG
jgi:serine/threonine protein kinase